MFTEGSIIAGKFRVDRVLGQGGMGVVVAATHIELGQRVALKFLLPEHCNDRAVVERFVREARAMAQLRSEHVCRVSDVGTLDNGMPYIVMELLDGSDLASLLVHQGPMPVAVLVDYVVQACSGLAEAHARRVVHRDLKPANLFLTRRPDGTPLIKILDFGIAKAPGTTQFHLTRTNAVMGSPGYMSPEQLRSSRDTDVRSDIWALGVILYELASGRPPFTAETITELTLRVAMDPTPVLHARNAPRGFEHAVYRCLEKDPARRFPDVAQLATALAAFGGSALRERALGVARVLSIEASSRVSDPSLSVAAMPTTLSASASSLEPRRRGPFVWGAVLGALAIAAAAIVLVGLSGRHEPTAAPEPAIEAPPRTTAAGTAPPSPQDAAVPVAFVDAGVEAAHAFDARSPLDATPPIDARSPLDAASTPPTDARSRLDANAQLDARAAPDATPRAAPATVVSPKHPKLDAGTDEGLSKSRY